MANAPFAQTFSARAFALAGAFACAVSCNGQFRFDDHADASAADATNATAACVIDSDCRLASLHCDVRSGKCVECAEDGHCPPDEPRCDLAEHQCVQCGVGIDCAAGHICESRQCVQTCPDGGGCPDAAPVCSAARGIRIRCTGNSDCSDSLTTPVCDSNGRCVQCARDRDCPAAAPYCDLDGDGCVVCLPPSIGCAYDTKCEPRAHVCVHQ
jgi:hypothetical protein